VRGVERIPWLYDGLCAVVERTGLAEWRRWLASGARGRTLDVGCGTGRGLALYGSGVRVIGLDLAWDSLGRARRRAPRVPLVQGSAEALPFRAETFDTVASSLVFCSVAEPAHGFAEVKRVLRPDGRLRMIEHVRSRRAWKAAFQDRVQPLWTWASGGCHPNRDTERAVERAGFAIETGDRAEMADMRRFSARVRR
jgi:ubiquinone/menaquinone biosynthesis C-methylase UbiE